ncbi:MAG: ABC transporter ATP-binding protein [Rhodospirillales bacterium]|nr:ABC transporter ATP-binding protein [Rhodospirillales bacterium]MCY3856220.1 ABC transporter ATP-binding protein [Rhodospirillales bacterium]MCY4097658.1 ABC transporter ATP-binding protein [Rhodospirillales bacterium]MYE19814.1 ABC transporter ATP-binding protein [Rhodospirillales bacterium]
MEDCRDPLLIVDGLSVTFDTPRGAVAAVRDVGFTLGREKLGIVGESGSGKSQTGRALLGLLARNGRMSARQHSFDGVDLLRAGEAERRALLGRRISMILQDPKFSLNPVMTVGEQIVEAFRVHAGLSRREAHDRALAMLEAVRIREPRYVFDAWPHEISGGMGQRVMIAMMMVPEPDLIIADEPTSALDVTVQLQVLALLDDMLARRGASLIFISHDLNLVASFCDRVLVMYAGRVVETLGAAELHAARHPYTRGLLACQPRVDGDGADLPTLHRDPAWAR